MTEQIKQELSRIESQYDVKIILAIESGSRAWGFHSPNSDYDVRFIYTHPQNHYLSIEKHRDVIEEMLPNDLDISGWDLPKALNLLAKSNPPLLEWFHSPIVYQSRPTQLQPLKNLLKTYFSLTTCQYHYINMATTNLTKATVGDQIILKKYLYVLRPILACLYIEKYKSIPPVEFQQLVKATLTNQDIIYETNQLVAKKQKAEELALSDPIPLLHDFITTELDRLQKLSPKTFSTPNKEPLNQYFRKTLQSLAT